MIDRPKIASLFMAVLLVIYLGFTINYAWILVQDPSLLVQVMGYALVVLPLLGAWGLTTELLFARRASKLTEKLRENGMFPDIGVTSMANESSRRNAALQEFGRFRKETQNNPDSWESWLRLGLVYYECGDKRRARSAVRKAISINRGV